MKKFFPYIFVLIFLLGGLLRFYQLDTVPASLEWDEVSFGYNAHALQQTGTDEYGERLPFSFRAFGEYKQPVYMYLEVAAVSIFGLNPFAVRFPAAFFGTLSMIVVFLVTFEFFRKTKYAKNIALLSMFFFAISPWSIQFSRGAFEATVSLFLLITGVWLFLRGLYAKTHWYFYISVLALSLSTYTYISQKIIAPVLFVTLIIYGLSYLRKNKKLAGILIVVFILFNSLWLFDVRSVSRGQSVIFTNQQTQILDKSIQQMQLDKEASDQFGILLHNRRIVFGQELVSNYLSHYNPLWLFITGDEVKRHHAPGFGLLYLISLPLILAGIYFLISRASKITWPLFVWFLMAPMVSALTFEAPHALRSLIMLPTWHIFEAAGIIFILQSVTKIWLRKAILSIFAILLFGNILLYVHQYFVHTNTDFQKDWQYGYKEVILSLDQVDNKEKRIVFSKNFEQPYIFYLFYTKYDPEKYITQGSSWRTSQKCFTIDNAYFGDCVDKLRRGDLYVVSEDAVIDNTIERKRFNYTNGQPASRIFEYK